MAIKDLTPKLPTPILPAELELQLDPGMMEIGQRIGGLSAFSNAFKRGYGDNIFGIDENGMWMGSADFADGTIRITMDGQFFINDKTNDRVLLGKF